MSEYALFAMGLGWGITLFLGGLWFAEARCEPTAPSLESPYWPDR